VTTEGLTAVGPTGVNLLKMDDDKWQEFYDLLADVVHDFTIGDDGDKRTAVLEHMKKNNAHEELATFLGWFGGDYAVADVPQ